MLQVKMKEKPEDLKTIKNKKQNFVHLILGRELV